MTKLPPFMIVNADGESVFELSAAGKIWADWQELAAMKDRFLELNRGAPNYGENLHLAVAAALWFERNT